MNEVDLIKTGVQLLGFVFVGVSIIIASKNFGVNKANHLYNKTIKTYEFSNSQVEDVLKAFFYIKSTINENKKPDLKMFYDDEELYLNSLVLVNKFDLMARGIEHEVFDESVLKATYFTVLITSHSILSNIIDDLRESSKNEEFGKEFRKLYIKWSAVYLPKI